MCAPCVSPLLSGTLQVLGLCLLRALRRRGHWAQAWGQGQVPLVAPCVAGVGPSVPLPSSLRGAHAAASQMAVLPSSPQSPCEASVREDGPWGPLCAP